MSYELVGPIIARVQANNARALQKGAEQVVSAEAAIVHQVTTEALCKERAERLVALLKEGSRYRGAGFFERLVKIRAPKNTEPYIEHVRPEDGRYIHVPINFSRSTQYLEVGERTELFDTRRERHADMNFTIGTQVGMREEVSCYERGKEVSRRIPGYVPLWIWRVAQLEGSHLEERRIEFEVSANDGTVFSYTDGVRDDELLSLSKAAAEQALHIIDQAIVFLES